MTELSASRTMSGGPSGTRRRLRYDQIYWNVMLWPALIILFVVFIYPLIYSLYLSLTAYNLIGDPKWVGLRNYVRILTDAVVWNSIKVTMTFSVGAMAAELLIGFGVALVLHDLGVGRNFFRTMSSMPLMMTPVVIGLVWRMMGNYDYGVINYLTGLFGVEKLGWVVDRRTAMPYLIVADVWHTTGFVVLTLSAGLAQLPQEMYEAAGIDGASFWQKLWHLTIPMLAPVFNVVLIFRSYNLIRMFDKSMTLTTGGPGRATETLSFHIYNKMFEGYAVGYSTAVAMVLMAITLVACAYFIWKM